MKSGSPKITSPRLKPVVRLRPATPTSVSAARYRRPVTSYAGPSLHRASPTRRLEDDWVESSSSESRSKGSRLKTKSRQKKALNPFGLLKWLMSRLILSTRCILGLCFGPLVSIVINVLVLLAVLCIPLLVLYTWNPFQLPSLSWLNIPSDNLQNMLCTWTPFCDSDSPYSFLRPQAQVDVAPLAHALTNQIAQAQDLFGAVVALGDPAALGLHQTEIWELGVAIRASSALEDRNNLASELMELGDLCRIVKDALIGINSQGVNAFSWVLRRFQVVEKTIESMHRQESGYSQETVLRQLESLFEKLEIDLAYLLDLIEEAIPKADRASKLGGRIQEDIGAAHSGLVKEKEQGGLIGFLLDKNTYKGRQLARDIDLTKSSVQKLGQTRRNLEDARSFLLHFRDNTGFFKASLQGFHLADHGLSAEDEVHALQHILSSFGQDVHQAKRIAPRMDALD